MPFTLQEILLRASTHPTYVPVLHPEAKEVAETHPADLTLQSFKFIEKPHLIDSIQTLIDTDPTFLHGVYLSPTGGTRGLSVRLYFITDAKENKAQRQVVAQMSSRFGVLETTDIVMNLHDSMIAMYRSQDLSGEIISFAGATELSIGAHTTDDEVLKIGKRFRANTIFAQSSRLLQFARYMSGLPEEERFTIPKVLYTSEPLPPSQEVYIGELLGAKVLSGMFGSAEAGPWAFSIPRPIRKSVDADVTKGDYSELLFSRKQMVVEIISEDGEVLDNSLVESQSRGKVGEMVLTSLCRCRNPLIRYRTGDFASLHPYAHMNEEGEYVLLRFYGRSPITCFWVDGEYIETAELNERVFEKPEFDVLEWQVIISTFTKEELQREKAGTLPDWLEFRVVTKSIHTLETKEDYEEQVTKALTTDALGENLKIVVKMVDYNGFIRGAIARKFIKIVDRRPVI